MSIRRRTATSVYTWHLWEPISLSTAMTLVSRIFPSDKMSQQLTFGFDSMPAVVFKTRNAITKAVAQKKQWWRPFRSKSRILYYTVWVRARACQWLDRNSWRPCIDSHKLMVSLDKTKTSTISDGLLCFISCVRAYHSIVIRKSYSRRTILITFVQLWKLVINV